MEFTSHIAKTQKQFCDGKSRQKIVALLRSTGEGQQEFESFVNGALRDIKCCKWLIVSEINDLFSDTLGNYCQ